MAESDPIVERRHPLRFVWQMDADGRFIVGSDEFAALVGPKTMATFGRKWNDVAADLALDPDNQVARAIASQETWSGIVISCPVDESSERLPVELSGLPVFDRDRSFRGYRGFGVCRDIARINQLARTRRDRPIGFMPAPESPPEADGAPAATRQGPATADAAAPAEAATRVERPALSIAPASANVVPFRPGPAAESKTPALSPVERRAFRELAQELTARLRGAPDAAAVAEPGTEGALAEASPAAGVAAESDPALFASAMPSPANEAAHHAAADPALAAAETELRNAEREVQKAATAKAEFLAKVSHEIRTPLSVIIGFAEVMMAERFGPIGNERYREYLKDIHGAGMQLVALLNDLLDLSKVDTGKLDLTFGNVSVNDLTQQCVGVMQPQANRARIIIRTSLTPGLPQVVADERTLRQIVLNLLANSIKFTGPGGQVIVSTAVSDGNAVVLRVRDTGIGMNEKDIEAALEPCRQVATSEGWDSGGTGLTLPLTKALAEANRANFAIKSAPNAGTLVEVAFPPSRVVAN